MPKVVHIITELNVGGAENDLYKLIRHSDRERFDFVVISLQDQGAFGEPIRALGVPVYTLGMNPSRPNPLALIRLVRILRREQPDIVHTWLYHAVLMGTLAAFFVPHRALVWSILNATIVNLQSGVRRLIFRACALLSGRPDFIVANTEVGRDLHIGEGYRDDGKWRIIYNGFETDRFQPDADTRQRVRAALGLPDGVAVIGTVGRLTPEKDYPGFITAALKLLAAQPDVHFVAIGKDVMHDSLGHLIPAEQRDRFHLLGLRRDVPDLLNAFDVFTLASRFEGFPNVVGEAMATALPVVVTDVGDVVQLVGDAGIVVPPGDSDAMAAAWSRMLALSLEERVALGESARSRVVSEFGILHFVERYIELYRSLSGE